MIVIFKKNENNEEDSQPKISVPLCNISGKYLLSTQFLEKYTKIKFINQALVLIMEITKFIM